MLGGLGELGGGLLVLLGFLTPLGAIGVFASMLMAVVKLRWSNGLWATSGGYEYALVIAIISLVIGITGPGAYSIDALIGFSIPLSFVIVGFVAVVIVDFIGIAISNRQTPETQQKTA